VSGSYRGERMGSHIRKDIVQKGRISRRLPRDSRARLVSKTRPVNRNGSVVEREPFLKWPHFLSSGDRAQGGQHKDDRSRAETVISDPNLLTLPTPNDAIRRRLHADFLCYTPSSDSGLGLVAMLRFVSACGTQGTNSTGRCDVSN
jgi:hypothetical protein